MKKLLLIALAAMLTSVATGCHCCSNPLRRTAAMPVCNNQCDTCQPQQQQVVDPCAPAVGYSGPLVMPGPIVTQ